MFAAVIPASPLPITTTSYSSLAPARKSLGMGSSLQTMPVGHRDAADQCADDAQVALVGAAEIEVLHARSAVELLVGRTVNCPILMAGVPADGRGSEHVGIHHAAAEIG